MDTIGESRKENGLGLWSGAKKWKKAFFIRRKKRVMKMIGGLDLGNVGATQQTFYFKLRVSGE